MRFVRPCIILVWEPGPVIEESGVPFYFYQETQDFQLDTLVHIFRKFFFPKIKVKIITRDKNVKHVPTLVWK